MKNVFIVIACVIGLSTESFSKVLPIEYQIQKNYHRMKLVLNGDVRWNVSQVENTYTITLMGNEANFIVKNIGYNFNDGVIKKFNYKTTLAGTKKIVIELRNGVNDYHIYQDDLSKNLFIEFYPGRTAQGSIAKKISDKKPTTTVKNVAAAPQSSQHVVNIAQIVLDQVEQQPKSETVVVKTAPVHMKTPNTPSAALWLILVSISILLTGGGFTVYAFLRRKKSISTKIPAIRKGSNVPAEFGTILERSIEPITVLPSSRREIIIDNNDNDDNDIAFSHSTDFAEQYSRSQGEFDLQQRLESMSSRSTQKKIGVSNSLSHSKKKDPAILAQKLGLSVGELELVTRLQKFHKQQVSEVS